MNPVQAKVRQYVTDIWITGLRACAIAASASPVRSVHTVNMLCAEADEKGIVM